MCLMLYIMAGLFLITGIAEWTEKRMRAYREKHPRLNYRKQWM